MEYRRGALIAVCAGLLTAAPAWGQLFSEDFNDGNAASRWSVVVQTESTALPTTGPDGRVVFDFDYSTIGIANPSGGADTIGAFLQFNLTDQEGDEGESYSIYPNGQNFSGNFALELDMFVYNDGNAASTEHGHAGVFLDNNNPVSPYRHGTVGGPLAWGFSGEGGDGAGDLHRYAEGGPTSTGYVAISDYNLIPPGTIPGFQTGVAGSLGPAAPPNDSGSWVRVRIEVHGTNVNWYLNGALIDTYDNSAGFYTSGNILIGGMDPFNSVNSGNGVVVDNVVVTQIVAPTFTQHPQTQGVIVDGTVSFTAAAQSSQGNPALSFQWFQGATPLSNGVLPDGTVVTIVDTDPTTTLTLSNVQPGLNGQTFSVVATDVANETAASNQAILHVLPLPCNDPFADADADGFVDMNDYGRWQQCYTGEGGAAFDFNRCRCFDRDRDSDVDENDLLVFTACIGSHPLPADPACDDSFYPTGTVVINEFIYDQVTATGGATADTGEFVELYNAGQTPVDISGWMLRASDQESPEVTVENPVPDDNPDYVIPGAPGSGTTVLAPGAYYVIGAPSVENVNLVVTSPSTQGLWEDTREAIELIDGNGNVIDTVVYNKQQGGDGDIAIGTPEGRIWGDLLSVAVHNHSVARYLDGLDTDSNGRDFGMRLPTPGASNLGSGTVVTAYVPPNVDGAAPESPVAGLSGAFTEARVIDPTVQSSPVAPAGLNPNAIPPSPQGGNCIIAWDEAGGGNAVWSNDVLSPDGGFDFWVYLDTSDITVPGAESTSYGIMGTTDPFYTLPDPTGNLFPNTEVLSNGNTGLAWVYQKDNANNHKRLVFVDARDGGDSSLFGGIYWVVVQEIDMSAMPSGWYRLSIAYTGASGAVEARFRDTSGTDLTAGGQPIQYSTQPHLVGGFYVGYRESLAGQPLTLRPPTFDGL